MRHIWILIGLMGLMAGLSACATAAPPTPTVTPTPAPPTPTVPTNTPFVRPTLPPTFTPTFTPSVTFTPSATFTPSITPRPSAIPEDVLCASFVAGVQQPDGFVYALNQEILLSQSTGDFEIGVMFELRGDMTENVQRLNLTGAPRDLVFSVAALATGRYDWTVSLFDIDREGLCPISGFFFVDPDGDGLSLEEDDSVTATPTATASLTRAPKDLEATLVPTITKTTLELEGQLAPPPATAAPTESPVPTASPEVEATESQPESTPEAEATDNNSD